MAACTFIVQLATLKPKQTCNLITIQSIASATLSLLTALHSLRFPSLSKALSDISSLLGDDYPSEGNNSLFLLPKLRFMKYPRKACFEDYD